MAATSPYEHSSIKRDDQPAAGAASAAVDLTHLLGTWINTYRETRSLTRFILRRSGSGYVVEAQVAGEEGEKGLGAIDVRPFAANVDSATADGFTAQYSFGFLEMLLAAYGAKGLIVVSQYTRFTDGSGRPDYFNREFFFKEEA